MNREAHASKNNNVRSSRHTITRMNKQAHVVKIVLNSVADSKSQVILDSVPINNLQVLVFDKTMKLFVERNMTFAIMAQTLGTNHSTLIIIQSPWNHLSWGNGTLRKSSQSISKNVLHDERILQIW